MLATLHVTHGMYIKCSNINFKTLKLMFEQFIGSEQLLDLGSEQLLDLDLAWGLASLLARQAPRTPALMTVL